MTRRLPVDALVEEVELELDEHTLMSGQYRRKRIDERVARLRTKRDALAGLLAAKEALEHHDYVPRAVAEWMANGIALYLSGRRKSLDDALGLVKPGRAHPLRRAKEEHALRSALGRMFHLHILGATIPQAAALVAAKTPDYAVDTLIDRYRRGGYTADVKKVLALNLMSIDPTETLAEYPDQPLEVRQAKDAIRAMYVKRRA